MTDATLPFHGSAATRMRSYVSRSVLVGGATALPLVAGVLIGGPMAEPWPGRYYLALHTVVETLVVVVAFATFAVQWYAAGARLNDARARFIGSAFLATSLLELLHVVAFPGMPGLGWIASSTERGIVYWLAARVCTVGALLAAPAIPRDSESRALRRGPLALLALGSVAAVVAVDAAWISRAPLFFVEGTGLTGLKKGLEILVAATALAGVLVYRRDRDDSGARDIATALWLTVLSELCFALYARAYDSYNLLGHAYLLLASYGVFHALFVDALLRPYERLDATSRDLAVSNAKLMQLRQHVEGELAVTIRNLETLQEQREDFVRAVSHDLRSPLQVVYLQAERLARWAGGEGDRRAGQAIATAARQMSAMIQDLVDSVRLESGSFRIERQALELKPFLTELVSVASGPVETDRISVDVPPDLPAVSVDPSRIARVVQNLVGNAIKYSAPATPVVIRAVARGRDVVVSVSDQGPGIGAEHLPQLFQRFYRGARNGNVDGLGLGLYISRRIVEAHEGTISCESVVGVGSTFSFSVPIHAPSPVVERSDA